MYKMCKTEQSAQRQRELEQGLLHAMLAHPYEEISVSDLCDNMEIPRKSFYRYFSSKDGALHALIDHTMLEYESFAGSVMPRERRTYQRELERFFLFWKSQKTLLDALSRSDLSSILVMRAIEMAKSDMGVPMRFIQREERLAREHAIMFGVCGMMSMVLQWHYGGFETDAREMASIAVNLLTQPLFSNME